MFSEYGSCRNHNESSACPAEKRDKIDHMGSRKEPKGTQEE